MKVEIEGYVYARQFNPVNRLIAENPQIELMPEVLQKVLQKKNGKCGDFSSTMSTMSMFTISTLVARAPGIFACHF